MLLVGADSNEGRPGVPRGAGSAISAGFDHSCVLLANGSVKCWGGGGLGQLGQGNPNSIGYAANQMGDSLAPIALGTGRAATAVTAGGGYTCALLDNGGVKCWGYGGDGRLGQGNPNSIGDASNEMGDNLVPIAMGTGRTATAVTVGNGQSCALLDNGTVKCWGSGLFGRLGQGNTNSIGNAPNQMGDNLAPIALGTGRTATAVTVGNAQSCALLDNGTVKCWGGGASGQLGQGNPNSIGNAPNQMGDNLAPVPLGAGRTATAVTAGDAHTCASLDNGTVKCWAPAVGGRLGQGNTNNIGNASFEMAILQPVALGSVPGAVVVPVVVAPAAPTGLSGAAGVTSVLLSWASPGDNGGAPVTGYRVEISTDNSLNWATVVADTGSTAATRTIVGLAPGQPVTFRVAAINNHGVGVRSIPSAPLTPTTSPPGAFPAGSGYVSLDPVRLLDTRPDGGTIDGLFHPGTKLAGGQEIRLQVGGRGGVPTTAAAVVLNVTVTEPDAAGYITAYPCDTPDPTHPTSTTAPDRRSPATSSSRSARTAPSVCTANKPLT